MQQFFIILQFLTSYIFCKLFLSFWLCFLDLYIELWQSQTCVEAQQILCRKQLSGELPPSSEEYFWLLKWPYLASCIASTKKTAFIVIIINFYGQKYFEIEHSPNSWLSST